MRIQLSEHFDTKKLLRFVYPSILMMIFISLYSLVDGLFVANFCSKEGFVAVNLIFPVVNILAAFGFMFGIGGSALIGKKFGEKQNELANRYFSLITYVSIFVSIILSISFYFLVPTLVEAMGGKGQVLEEAIKYGQTLAFFIPFFLIQMEFQSFFIVAEKQKLGLFLTIGTGCLNMILDAIFVAGLKMGVFGAALATGICQATAAIYSLSYFSVKNNSLLRLGKTKFEAWPLLKSMANGSSELLTNISISVVAIFYNMQLMKFAQEDGVAANGVISYVSLIFLAIFFGYNLGVGPLISYNFGAKNDEELKNLTNKSLKIIMITSISMVVLAYSLSYPLSIAFSNGNQNVFNLTLEAFMFYSGTFLFCGLGIFMSAFFTDLNDGLVSAILSFLRTFVYQTICVWTLPLFFGRFGIWASLLISDFLSFVTAYIFFKMFQKKYHY